MNIYIQNISFLSVYVFLSAMIFVVLLLIGRQKEIIIKCINLGLFIVAFYAVIDYTVIGRRVTDSHTYCFFVCNNESFREMFMNALLYYPFGLTLTVVIGPWSILVAFLLSISIETWQYFAGTGLAQGTDVVMNTLGCAIGSIPYIAVRRIINKKLNTH